MTPYIKRLPIALLLVPILLLVPLVAMQFSTQVNWKVSDFIVMGILLTSAILLVEIVLRKVKTTKHRIILCAAIVIGFLLIWAELAVGLFGTPLAGS
jgi:Kef-type K+ transport system membrane component KefB